MRLTSFTDYSLRVLLYAALHEDRRVTVAEISQAYGISHHHLVKVAQLLAREAFLDAERGRKGGLKLARASDRIHVGAVVRATEPDFQIVECFDPQTNTCVIAPACDLKRALGEAQREFLRVLDGYTLADLVAKRRNKLRDLFGLTGSEPAA